MKKAETQPLPAAQATTPGPLIPPDPAVQAKVQSGDASRELAAALQRAHVPVVNGTLRPDSLDGYQRVARIVIASGMVPRSLEGRTENETLAKVTLVLEQGATLGLTTTQALSTLMVVNNRVCVWGDGIPALVRKSGVCAKIEETVNQQGATCTMIRINRLPDGTYERESITRTFAVEDAKRAGLWGKSGPWSNYPGRMLAVRARAFAARDGFADVLLGLAVAEEMGAYSEDTQPSAALADVRSRVEALPQVVPLDPVLPPVLPPVEAPPEAAEPEPTPEPKAAAEKAPRATTPKEAEEFGRMFP